MAALCRGVDPVELLSLLRGDWHCGYDPYEYRVAPQCTPLATNTLHAVGLAHAARLKGEDTVALVMLGDGATSEGDTHAALNFAGVWQAPVVFFVQNNGYAISVPLSKQSAAPSLAHKGIGYGVPAMLIDGNDAAAVYAAVQRAVASAAGGFGPTLIEALTYRIEAHTNADDATRYRRPGRGGRMARPRPAGADQAASARPWPARRARGRRLDAEAEAEAAALRQRMNTDSAGDPADLFRHVYAEPTPALRWQQQELAAELAGRSGRSGGIAMTAIAERRPGAPATTPEVTMAGALNQALADALSEDETVLVFGEDVGPLGGVFRVTDGLAARFGDARVFDTPLAESGIVGTAIGMAMNGLRPVVEMQFDAFAYPAFEQITSHLAKFRNRTRGRVALPVVIRIPYGGGIGGVEHHCDSSEAYYAHTPGLRVVTPATPGDAYALLRQAIECPDPSSSSSPSAATGPSRPRSWIMSAPLGPGHGAPGGLRRDAYRVRGDPGHRAGGGRCGRGGWLERRGHRPAELSPFDDETVTASVRRTGRAIVVHEASRFCGYGAEVAARVSEQCFHYLEAPVLRVTGFDIPYPPPQLEEYHLPSVDRILDAIDRLQWQETRPAVKAARVPAFLLPDLGEGLTEAEIVTWHVQAGNTVTVDQPIVEVETAKAVVEVPVPFAGRVAALHGQPGDVVAVGAPLVTVDTADRFAEPGVVTSAAGRDQGDPDQAAGSGNVLIGYGTSSGRRRRHRATRSPAAIPAPRSPAAGTAAIGASGVPAIAANGRVPVASPLIRQLARNAGVDLATIRGSGRDGLITRPTSRGDQSQAEPASAGCEPLRRRSAEVTRIPIRGLRKSVADKLSRSRREIPEATVWVDVDATEMLRLRAALNADESAPKISLLALLSRFTILALHRYPELNAKIEGDEIVMSPPVHLGFAAQTDRGLMVPVVRDAQVHTLEQLSVAVAERTRRAREGTLGPADLTGGTFTVNNYGVFGVDGSAAIINHPEVAILGVGRIIPRPWVVEDQIVPRAADRAHARVRPPGLRRRDGRRLPALHRRLR